MKTQLTLPNIFSNIKHHQFGYLNKISNFDAAVQMEPFIERKIIYVRLVKLKYIQDKN